MKATREIKIEFTEREKLAMSIMDEMWKDWDNLQGHCEISCDHCPFSIVCHSGGAPFEEALRNVIEEILDP